MRRAFLIALCCALLGCATQPEPLPEYIGDAHMAADGTLTLNLVGYGCRGEIGHAQIVFPTSHPRYREILSHIGEIRPGEIKGVRPWRDRGC